MDIIIASDIFGRTTALEEMVDVLSSDAISVATIDPYEGRRIDFADEGEAYAYFQKNVGIQRYRDCIFESVVEIKSDLILVGFSVGASAIWTLSDKISIDKKIKAVCFYGSQIRHYVDIMPRIPMDLYFPRHEPHFDVPGLIAQLSLKNRVTCSTVPYLHGFMNRKSRNFDASGYTRYLDILKYGL